MVLPFREFLEGPKVGNRWVRQGNMGYLLPFSTEGFP